MVLACFCVAAYAQQNYRTTPVPILKQINRHNDDGSYSYGYENADGSFKIETKYATGEVYGKYGYVGDDGKVREIEYGASRRGFEPAGSGINVPPPTLSNSNPDSNSLDYDDGQYREDPAIYNTYKGASKNKNRQPLARFSSNAPVAPAPARNYNNVPAAPAYNPPAAPAFRYSNPAPAPAPTPAPYYNPPAAPAFRYNNPVYHGLGAATNVNLQTGSYSLSYTG